jgi:hypothetical protein
VPSLSQNINGAVPTLKTSSGRSVVVQQTVNTTVSRPTTSTSPTAIGTGLVGVGYPGLGYGYNPWSSGYRRRSYGYGYGYGGYYRPRRYYVVRRNYLPYNGTNLAQDPSLMRLRAALESIPIGATASPATTSRLTNDLMGVVQGPIQPPRAPVQTLAGHLAAGVGRRTSQGFNGLTLARALKVGMNGAFLPRTEVTQAITLGQRSLRGYGVPTADIGAITRQLRVIALDNAPNGGANPAPAAVAAAPPAS